MREQRPSILLTGFEPFAGESINPSWEAVRRLHGARIGEHLVQARCLPVTFGGAVDALEAARCELQPAIVLAVGQAGGRGGLSFERIAVNLIDARIADNAGAQPIDQPVIEGAPAAYFATLPVKAMRAAVEQAGIAAELSCSAGCFVCNAVFFALMHRLVGDASCRGGFVHVPWLPEQAMQRAGEPSLPLDALVHGIECALRVALERIDDLRVAGGDTH